MRSIARRGFVKALAAVGLGIVPGFGIVGREAATHMSGEEWLEGQKAKPVEERLEWLEFMAVQTHEQVLGLSYRSLPDPVGFPDPATVDPLFGLQLDPGAMFYLVCQISEGTGVDMGTHVLSCNRATFAA